MELELEDITAHIAGAALTLHMRLGAGLVASVKSIETLAPVHTKQVLTYLRSMNLPVGLLINFGEAILKHGLKRIVNSYASHSCCSRVSA